MSTEIVTQDLSPAQTLAVINNWTAAVRGLRDLVTAPENVHGMKCAVEYAASAVVDASNLDEARTFFDDTHAAWTTIDKARKAAKALPLSLGNEVDAITKKTLDELALAKSQLATAIGKGLAKIELEQAETQRAAAAELESGDVEVGINLMLASNTLAEANTKGLSYEWRPEVMNAKAAADAHPELRALDYQELHRIARETSPDVEPPNYTGIVWKKHAKVRATAVRG